MLVLCYISGVGGKTRGGGVNGKGERERSMVRFFRWCIYIYIFRVRGFGQGHEHGESRVG